METLWAGTICVRLVTSMLGAKTGTKVLVLFDVKLFDVALSDVALSDVALDAARTLVPWQEAVAPYMDIVATATRPRDCLILAVTRISDSKDGENTRKDYDEVAPKNSKQACVLAGMRESECGVGKRMWVMSIRECIVVGSRLPGRV